MCFPYIPLQMSLFHFHLFHTKYFVYYNHLWFYMFLPFVHFNVLYIHFTNIQCSLLLLRSMTIEILKNCDRS